MDEAVANISKINKMNFLSKYSSNFHLQLLANNFPAQTKLSISEIFSASGIL